MHDKWEDCPNESMPVPCQYYIHQPDVRQIDAAFALGEYGGGYDFLASLAAGSSVRGLLNEDIGQDKVLLHLGTVFRKFSY
jgi:hypothetical protein